MAVERACIREVTFPVDMRSGRDPIAVAMGRVRQLTERFEDDLRGRWVELESIRLSIEREPDLVFNGGLMMTMIATVHDTND